ncbi:protease SohB [Chromatocurvus halotolerans]|uniref:Inner membrane peptidase n=1 Tax=Chromatocurvus halotolerans TaxID=1132028 RepID=A0A4R2KPD4_9GAMM|nr:protease SohB [Chromatocurvus halotolerans]TCO72716.1 inner membrane peptidase [Chromatocurvus halotolerans]
MEFLSELGLFAAQAVTLLVLILLLALGLVAISQRQRGDHDGHIEITRINQRAEHVSDTLNHAINDPQTWKAATKARKKAEKVKVKQRKKALKAKKGGSGQESPADEPQRERPVLFVLDFDGDIHASATDNLREEISAIVPQLKKGDEVLVRLESPGGVVHGYGLAASQLRRIRDAGTPLTVCVDKVAASGGYMMACVADRIIAAPFAVIGSIGVLAQLPNFHRLLKKNDIDFELLTAGEYKRTLTLFGENTDKGREKFVEELEETHALFKHFVKDNRPALDIDRVATGEIWYGQQALDEGLVDELATSDATIQARLEGSDVFEIRFVRKRNWQEKLGMAAGSAVERSLLRLWQYGVSRRLH